MSRRRAALRGFAIATCAALGAVVALLLAVGSSLAAHGDEWSVPLRIGAGGFGLRLDAGVAELARWATRPLGLRLLDGRSIETRSGTFVVARIDDERFAIECRRCRLRFPAFGDEALHIGAVRFVGTLRDGRLHGALSIGDLHGRVAGRFGTRGLTIDLDLGPAPVRAYFEAIAPALPELAVATIEGRAVFAVRIELPSSQVSIRPTIEGFAVSGLGTERLAGRAPLVACGATGPVGNFGKWLPLAVMAAEDQRFERHPGYDLDELAASMARAELASRIERGGSTIGQQLAKLLYVGDDRRLTRKLRELLYAVELEQTLGKARMLKLYLTIVPWGRGTCGADAAARRYVGKPPARSRRPRPCGWPRCSMHPIGRRRAGRRRDGSTSGVRSPSRTASASARRRKRASSRNSRPSRRPAGRKSMLLKHRPIDNEIVPRLGFSAARRRRACHSQTRRAGHRQRRTNRRQTWHSFGAPASHAAHGRKHR